MGCGAITAMVGSLFRREVDRMGEGIGSDGVRAVGAALRRLTPLSSGTGEVERERVKERKTQGGRGEGSERGVMRGARISTNTLRDAVDGSVPHLTMDARICFCHRVSRVIWRCTSHNQTNSDLRTATNTVVTRSSGLHRLNNGT